MHIASSHWVFGCFWSPCCVWFFTNFTCGRIVVAAHFPKHRDRKLQGIGSLCPDGNTANPSWAGGTYAGEQWGQIIFWRWIQIFMQFLISCSKPIKNRGFWIYNLFCLFFLQGRSFWLRYNCLLLLLVILPKRPICSHLKNKQKNHAKIGGFRIQNRLLPFDQQDENKSCCFFHFSYSRIIGYFIKYLVKTKMANKFEWSLKNYFNPLWTATLRLLSVVVLWQDGWMDAANAQ